MVVSSCVHHPRPEMFLLEVGLAALGIEHSGTRLLGGPSQRMIPNLTIPNLAQYRTWRLTQSR